MHAHRLHGAAAATPFRHTLARGRRRWPALSLVLALALVPGAPGLAQEGGGGGSGGGGGGGGDADTTGSDFSDMVVALRDIDGIPILKDFTYVDDEGATVTDRCVQPISYSPLPGVDPTTNGVDGEEVWLVPLQGEDLAEATEELEVCDPKPNYAYYVAEAELERLNQARTTEDVMDRKIAEVVHRLLGTSVVTLDPAGRLVTDGLLIDAGPENAAIHETLLETGTLENLGSDPASVDPIVGHGDPLDAWELAATALGGAASKYTPLSIDSILYYNRVTNVVEDSITDPAAWQLPYKEAFNGTRLEKFIDYSGFSYNRNTMFPGAATWFDIDTMTWNVGRLLSLVDFDDLPASADLDGTLHNAAAFAQLVDDARAVIAFIHQYEVLTGFHADPVRVDTFDEQSAAIVNPAVAWSDLPAQLVQTRTVPVTATALNPWMGTAIADALLQIRISAPEAFTDPSQVTAVSVTVGSEGVHVPFSLDDGDLVGHWGPPSGFLMPKNYNESTTFDVTVADDAPVGTYTLALDLVSVSDPEDAEPRATATTTLEVSDDVLTAWWEHVPVVTDQAAYTPMTAAVFHPWSLDTVSDASLRVTFDAEADFTSTSEVKAYLDAVGMSFVLDGGDLVGTWPLGDDLGAMAPGFDEAFTWQVFVADGAPLGLYTLTLDVLDSGGTVLTDATATAETTVAEAVVHGRVPGDFTVTLTPVGELGSDAAFEFAAEGDASGVIFQCKLERNGELWIEHGDEVEEEWMTCQSPKAYTGLPDGSYEFSVRGKRGEVLSPVISTTWVVDAGIDPGDPTDPGDPSHPGGPTDPADPTDPGGPTGDGQPMRRAGGSTRIETAVLTSEIAFPGGASTAVVARSDTYPDALTGTPLAAVLGGPILLTPSDALHDAVVDELERLGVAHVVLLGGETALSSSLEAALEAMDLTVERIAGADRFETAAKVAQRMPDHHAYVVEGADADPSRGWPDALAVGPLAALHQRPVLLVETDGIPAATGQALASMTSSTVVGGEVAVSAAVQDAIGRLHPVDRVAGADRYETAMKLADLAVAAGADPSTTFVATGEAFPDALSAGAATAARNGVMLLVNGRVTAGAAPYWLQAHVQGDHELVIVGGPDAIAEHVAAQLEGAIG